jgi:hypothetical protein
MVGCRLCGFQAQRRMAPSCPWCGSHALLAVAGPAPAAAQPDRGQTAKRPTGLAARLADVQARRQAG